MPLHQRSNFLPDILQYLDAQDEDCATALDTACEICRENKLDISRAARPLTLTTTATPPSHWKEKISHAARLCAQGFERTFVLPCGHVFGERCLTRITVVDTILRCPSCGYQMTYPGCGHSIAPSRITVNGTRPIRDTIPLTIPEGVSPRNCKQCRWRAIRARMRYALGVECVICAEKAAAGVPPTAATDGDAAEHVAHRARHFSVGVREALAEIVELAQPTAQSRVVVVEARGGEQESETTLDRRRRGMEQDEADRRAVNISLLNAIVLTEMEDTVWSRTPPAETTTTTTTTAAPEALRRHSRGLTDIEDCVLGWLMDQEGRRRRVW